MPPLRLFGWSRMTSADRCGMRQLLSQVDVMECHSVGVRVEEKAAQCRVMEKTTCCHDTVWTGCGIWRDHWSLYEQRLQQRVCMTHASLHVPRLFSYRLEQGSIID